MKSFYEFAMEQGWIQFVLMFIAIASFIEIGYVGVTADIESLSTYGIIVAAIWLFYFMLLMSVYERQLQKEFRMELKRIFDEEIETGKEYQYYFAPPDGLYIMTERGEYYLKICEVEEVSGE